MGTARVFVQGALPAATKGYSQIVWFISMDLELAVLLTVLVVDIAAVDVVVVGVGWMVKSASG